MTWELSDCSQFVSALLDFGLRSANQIWASPMTPYVMLRHLVADWLRPVRTPSGKNVRQLNCMQIWNTSFNVVNWHFPGISLISIDHHASVSAPFCVILVSTPLSTVQGTRNSFRLETCGLDVELLRFPWSLLELHPGGLFFDNRLKSYRYTNFELEYLDIQGELWHAVETDTPICISSF